MRCLVTGASGFIGSYVVDNLLKRDIEVIAFDRHNHREKIDGVEQYLADTRDSTAVNEAVGLSDGVIHLAGCLGTQETINNPWPAVETNVQGGLNVYQACRAHGKKAAYITVGNYWMLNSYSITKTTSENLAWMFNNEHHTEIAVVRALNAYGPRQKAAPVRKIMPNFILPALRGEAITVYGDGSQIMDMIAVQDVADVMVRALLEDHGQYHYIPQREDLDNPVKFEAGTGRRTTVKEIAEMVIAEVGQGELNFVPMRPGEPENSVVLGDPETLRPLYGGDLPILTTLEDGIKATVAYYREHMM